MNLYPNPRSLSVLWRRQLEMALEAGRTPVLALGWDKLHPDSAFSLDALRRLARSRPGAVDPWVVAGGEGGLWLLSAIQDSPAKTEYFVRTVWNLKSESVLKNSVFGLSARESIQWQKDRQGGALYGGNDSATFAATLNLAESVRTDVTGAALPGGMAWMLTPTAAPGSEGSEGEYLPFALAAEEFSPLPMPEAAADWLERLESLGVALLALGLLVAALLF